MKSVFISTKLRTTDTVDWSTALKSYLSKLYGTFTDFTKEVDTINRLRVDANNSSDDPINYVKAKNLYYKYYGQLELLDLRLPIQEQGVRVKFRWYDAYDDSVHHSQYSLAFEKASILFNLASILSKSATENFEEADYKSSYQYFQYSAGIYKFISDNFLHAPSTDLSGNTVVFLEHLNLSQAQEVFLLKLIAEDELSKASLISKLAASTANHYEKTLTAFEKVEGTFGEESKWTKIVKYKQQFYRYISFYFHAQSIEEKKIGEAIAFYKLAYEGFVSLKRVENLTTIDFKTYQSQSDEKVRLLTKDNDFIYHDTIPSKDSIDLNTAVKPLDAAKPIPLNDHVNITEIIGEDVFEKVIPMNVHEKLSLYSEEKASVLRSQIEKNDTTNTELVSFLEYLRLPGSLEDFKSSLQNKLDPKVLNWSDEVSRSPLSDIKTNTDKIKSKRDEILKLIKESEAKLEEEGADYEKYRQQLSGQQEPSFSQSANLKDELTNSKKSLLTASELDQQTNDGIKNDVLTLNILRSKVSLESYFFQSDSQSLLDLDDSSNDRLVTHIKQIEDDLKALQKLKKERELIIEELKNAIHEDDISNLLVLNGKSLSEKDERTLFDRELAKFDPISSKLDLAISKQPQLVKEIKVLYDKVISSSSKIKENAVKISALDRTYHHFKEYEVNYGKATSFYDSLLSFINDVKSNVEKYVSDRYIQRQRLLNQSQPPPPQRPQQYETDSLKERFSQLNVNSTPSYNYQHPLNPVRTQSFTSDRSSISSNRQDSFTSPSYSQPVPGTFVQSNPIQNNQQPQQYRYNQGPSVPTQYQSSVNYSAQPISNSNYSSYQQPPQQSPQVPNYPVSINGPPLPPKQGSQTTQPPGNTYQQGNYFPSGISGLQSNQAPYNNAPPTYDQSSYTSFDGGNLSDRRQSQPRYSSPYDPSKPYP